MRNKLSARCHLFQKVIESRMKGEIPTRAKGNGLPGGRKGADKLGVGSGLENEAHSLSSSSTKKKKTTVKEKRGRNWV